MLACMLDSRLHCRQIGELRRWLQRSRHLRGGPRRGVARSASSPSVGAGRRQKAEQRRTRKATQARHGKRRAWRGGGAAELPALGVPAAMHGPNAAGAGRSTQGGCNTSTADKPYCATTIFRGSLFPSLADLSSNHARGQATMRQTSSAAAPTPEPCIPAHVPRINTSYATTGAR